MARMSGYHRLLMGNPTEDDRSTLLDNSLELNKTILLDYRT
jgi:hypothetical protein